MPDQDAKLGGFTGCTWHPGKLYPKICGFIFFVVDIILISKLFNGIVNLPKMSSKDFHPLTGENRSLLSPVILSQRQIVQAGPTVKRSTTYERFPSLNI